MGLNAYVPTTLICGALRDRPLTRRLPRLELITWPVGIHGEASSTTLVGAIATALLH